MKEAENSNAAFARLPATGFADLERKVDTVIDGRGGPFAFRGYNTLSNALATGLERTCESIDGGQLTSARKRELALIREFQRRAHHYLSDVPASGNWLEWLALMQHHGAPTRLLDWTYSLHVATHFAVSHSAREDAGDLAIWMIDTRWCREESKAVAKPGKSSSTGFLSRDLMGSRDEDGLSAELLNPGLAATVWPVNPFRLNERLTLQKGVFLAPGDPTKTFVANLKELDRHWDRSCLVQFVIPRAELPAVSRVLYKANVTEATLFPGLDGFARSLQTSLRFLSLDGLSSLDNI